MSLLIEAVGEQKLREEIEFVDVRMPKENLFYLMSDHATNHRARAILYLRMNGIELLRYRGGKLAIKGFELYKETFIMKVSFSVVKDT